MAKKHCFTAVRFVTIVSMLIGYGCRQNENRSNTISDVKERTQWMADGTYGLMVHYLINPEGETDEEKTAYFNRIVDCFDVDTFIAQFERTGADWLIFTLGQNTGYYCSPNTFLDEHLPGRTSQRDVAMEIAQRLAEIDKKLILYLPAEVMHQSETIREVFAWDTDDYSEFLNRYLQFLSYYSVKFGDLCSGWWFDGCYETYHPGGDAYWQKWVDAARAGNPDSIIALNDGAFCVNKIEPVSAVQDYHAGEVHMLENGKIRTDVIREFHDTYKTPDGYLRAKGQDATFHMPDSRFIYGVQWHALVPVDSSFNAPPVPVEVCQYSDDELAKFIFACKDVSGAVTFNLPIDGCGTIPEETVAQFERLGKRIKDNYE